MKYRIWITLTLFTLLSTRLLAGTVYEIEMTDLEQSPPTAATREVAFQGSRLKMVVESTDNDGDGGDMIWQGDLRQMIVIDHGEKSYMVMDEATIKSLSDKMGQVSAQMAEAMKNVPPEQRAMVERMMKGRMPEQAPKGPVTELVRTSESADKNGYPCVKYNVLADGREVRQLWVTDWKNLEGGEDASRVFLEMSDFFSAMLESVSQFSGLMAEDTARNAFAQLKELNGFPVVTEELAGDGSVANRSVLHSTREQAFEPDDFEPPAGYKMRSMMPQ